MWVVELNAYIIKYGADLVRAILSGAELTRFDLTRANLIDANMSGADEANANLSWQDLIDANLSGATMPDGTIHD